MLLRCRVVAKSPETFIIGTPGPNLRLQSELTTNLRPIERYEALSDPPC